MTAGISLIPEETGAHRAPLEIGHLCRAWSRNSPPRLARLGGVPRAINSSLEASGGVVDQRREATL